MGYLLLSDDGGRHITIRIPRQPVNDEPRVLGSKPPLPLFNAGHDRSNVRRDRSHRWLPLKGK